MPVEFRDSKITKDGKKLMDGCRNLKVNEEYNCALRTKSYVDFFTKAQLLVLNDHDQPPSPSYSNQKFAEFLLEPGQQTIAQILESAKFLLKESNLKALMLDYFNITAEASKICSHLLESINTLHSQLGSISSETVSLPIKMLITKNHTRNGVRNVEGESTEGPTEPDSVPSSEPRHVCTEPLSLHHSWYGSSQTAELVSLVDIFKNPFPNLGEQDFKLIHEKYSSVLHHLKSKKRKVGMKMKMINSFNKASGIGVTAACGLVAMAAIVIAAHTFTALLMGPVILSLPMKPIKKKIQKFHFLRLGFLKKVREQLDVAAKGTYILDRDFDMMSRMVARLHDEVEHNRRMLRLCLESREEKFSVQVLGELRKSVAGFRKQVEELEEHVYLCLLTINRGRALVIREISRDREGALV